MADSIFTTAAAKLLNQHAARTQEIPAGNHCRPAPTAAAPPPKNPDIEKLWQSAPTENAPVAPQCPAVEEHTNVRDLPVVRPRSFPLTKVLLITVPAALGCGAMVTLVSPTIFGFAGNIAIGLLGGAALGAIIAAEL